MLAGRAAAAPRDFGRRTIIYFENDISTRQVYLARHDLGLQSRRSAPLTSRRRCHDLLSATGHAMFSIFRSLFYFRQLSMAATMRGADLTLRGRSRLFHAIKTLAAPRRYFLLSSYFSPNAADKDDFHAAPHLRRFSCTLSKSSPFRLHLRTMFEDIDDRTCASTIIPFS